MESIRKIYEVLKDSPELQKKIAEETARFAENGAADEKEALIKAVRENLDIELTLEELDRFFAKAEQLDPEQMAQAAGGQSDFVQAITRIVKSPGMYGLTGTATVAGAGAALGTVLLPVPLAGTVIGGIAGGIVGSLMSAGLGLFGG